MNEQWFILYESGQFVVARQGEYDATPYKYHWSYNLEEALRVLEQTTGRTVVLPILLK